MVRVSVMVANTNLSSEADDFSVSSSRDEKINAKGIALRVGPAVWRPSAASLRNRSLSVFIVILFHFIRQSVHDRRRKV